MLRFMRKHAKGFLIKALFALIIIVFIFWGVGTFRERERIVAEVDGRKITFTEYNENFRRFYSLLKDKEGIEEKDIKEKALYDLIDKYILLEVAEKAGLGISEREFFEHLSSLEIFKKEGKFDRNRYLHILKRNNMDPKAFEEKEKREMLIAKMVKIIKDTVHLDEDEIWSEYVKERGMIELSYMTFDPDKFMSGITIDEKDVEEIYEKEKERLREEDLYRIRYLMIPDKGPVNDATAYMELLKERNLEAYAKERGLKFVDMGWKTKKGLLEDLKDFRIEEWLKDLRKGEFSLPVRVGETSYIFELFDFKRGNPLKKEIAEGIIRERMKKEKALLIAKAKAEEVIEKGNFSWNGRTGLMSRKTSYIKGIGSLPEEAKGVLNLNEKEKIWRRPVSIDGRFYIFSFEREEAPKKDIWEKEKAIFRELIIMRKGEEALRNFLDERKSKMDIKIYKELL